MVRMKSMMIVFRRVENEGIQAEQWYVEAYSDEGHMFPVGMAFVIVWKRHAQLNFIFVSDEWRRQGFATRIVEACMARWPRFTMTTGMNPAGQALHAKFNPDDPDHGQADGASTA